MKKIKFLVICKAKDLTDKMKELAQTFPND